jgi:hypothetical protein
MKEKMRRILAKCPPIYRVVRKIYRVIIKKDGGSWKSFSHTYRVSEILLQQNREGGYQRLDTFVRLLAIENEYGKNDFGWNYYRKMQKARCDLTDSGTEERVAIFKALIKSWEENGYDAKSEILLDRNLNLRDGGHRMALALYHGLDKINCQVMNYENDTDYGKEWFIENGFSCDEIANITNKANEIFEKNEVRMACLIWPPAEKYFDEITEKIKLMYNVVSCEDFTFSSEETFPRFVKAVYGADDIAEWKVDKKLEYMSDVGDKNVRYIVCKVDTPYYRSKGVNGNLILTQGERLKKIIRKCYQGEIENYINDVIIHTTDNNEQFEYVDRLMHPTFSMVDYIDKINNLKYVFLKHDTGYMTHDFPKTFPFSKDLDMLVSCECFDELTQITEKFFRDRCSGVYDELKITRKEDKCIICIELRGYMVYQVDISCLIDGMDADYCKSIVENRVKNDAYWLPALEDEICVRACEYIKYPKKKRHLEYVKNHASDINKDKILNYVEKGDEFLRMLEQDM